MLKIQIIDDDPAILDLLDGLIRSSLETCLITRTETPTVVPGQNVYVIDNSFECEQEAIRLADTARRNAPDALIIAYSSTLDELEWKALVNAGCNTVGCKSDPADLGQILGAIRAYESRHDSDRQRRTLRGSVDSIRQLIDSWNERVSS